MLRLVLLLRKAWNTLPNKGDLSQDISKIRQGPDEHFQVFVNSLIKQLGECLEMLMMGCF